MKESSHRIAPQGNPDAHRARLPLRSRARAVTGIPLQTTVPSQEVGPLSTC